MKVIVDRWFAERVEMDVPDGTKTIRFARPKPITATFGKELSGGAVASVGNGPLITEARPTGFTVNGLPLWREYR